MDMSENIRERLWETRQQLYRLYDIESITEWKIKDLLVLYSLLEEYKLAELLRVRGGREGKKEEEGEKDKIINNLTEIKAELNAKISEANKNKDIEKKSMLTKKLDKILTLIALVEADKKEAIDRLLSLHRLMKRRDNMLLKALQNYNEDNSSRSAFEEAITILKEELEREIIELKKRL
ncbi:MAG: hypothetical protein QW653_06105 [Candidatus Nitrosocaldus sp.]